jgi:hypothetical protein
MNHHSSYRRGQNVELCVDIYEVSCTHRYCQSHSHDGKTQSDVRQYCSALVCRIRSRPDRSSAAECGSRNLLSSLSCMLSCVLLGLMDLLSRHQHPSTVLFSQGRTAFLLLLAPLALGEHGKHTPEYMPEHLKVAHGRSKSLGLPKFVWLTAE